MVAWLHTDMLIASLMKNMCFYLTEYSTMFLRIREYLVFLSCLTTCQNIVQHVADILKSFF